MVPRERPRPHMWTRGRRRSRRSRAEADLSCDVSPQANSHVLSARPQHRRDGPANPHQPQQREKRTIKSRPRALWRCARGHQGARWALPTPTAGRASAKDRAPCCPGTPRTETPHQPTVSPANADTVVSSSISSVLESSSFPPAAKGGEVTGGASGRLGLDNGPWQMRAGETAPLFGDRGRPGHGSGAGLSGDDVVCRVRRSQILTKTAGDKDQSSILDR